MPLQSHFGNAVLFLGFFPLFWDMLLGKDNLHIVTIFLTFYLPFHPCYGVSIIFWSNINRTIEIILTWIKVYSVGLVRKRINAIITFLFIYFFLSIYLLVYLFIYLYIYLFLPHIFKVSMWHWHVSVCHDLWTQN